ncbi:hypothetical protein LTR36_006937 [Oleoguttula mirabilis]|uniref:Uncharacterized protein n=1 Tax=Oleoguttula mirabilis TaxID=1507867 RepID=A0AAV9JBV1_9PEZI|nr:hypothetical protein LTR36_006937 [Oleoguttula mirabilis]
MQLPRPGNAQTRSNINASRSTRKTSPTKVEAHIQDQQIDELSDLPEDPFPDFERLEQQSSDDEMVDRLPQAGRGSMELGNDPEDVEEDPEEERQHQFRSVWAKHLREHEYKINDIAASPILFAEVVMSFIDNNKAVIEEYYFPHGHGDSGNPETPGDDPDQSTPESDDDLEVSAYADDRDWSVDEKPSEHLTADSVLCPTCPSSRIYTRNTSFRNHYKTHHLGWQTGLKKDSEWKNLNTYKLMRPMLMSNTSTYRWKTEHGNVTAGELKELAIEWSQARNTR